MQYLSWVFVFTSLLPFPSVSPPSPLKGRAEVGRGMQNHCTDCCKKSEWIGVSVYVCVRVWVPQGVCGFFCFCFFLFLFFFELTQIIEDKSLEWHTCEIPLCTWLPLETAAAKLTDYNRWSVQACTQKWPLNARTWPTFKRCRCSFFFFNNLDQKEKKSLG